MNHPTVVSSRLQSEIMVQNLDRIAENCTEESWCEMTATAVMLGRKWKPVVVRRLLRDGPSRFNDIKDDVGDISNQALSNTLEELERTGLVDRSVISERPQEVEYALTERGEALEPVLGALEAWGEVHLEALCQDDPPEVPQ